MRNKFFRYEKIERRNHFACSEEKTAACLVQLTNGMQSFSFENQDRKF
jgi:hypothetical protein